MDQHIKTIIIEQVKKLPPVDENAKPDGVEIAVVSYGYNNQKMIYLLQKRGKLLGNGKFNEFLKNETSSDKLLFSMSDERDLKVPNRAFITFTTHEAALRC